MVKNSARNTAKASENEKDCTMQNNDKKHTVLQFYQNLETKECRRTFIHSI